MKTKLETLELDLLLSAIYQHYGYDFSNYASASLKRRIRKVMDELKVTKISELIPLLLHDRVKFNVFLSSLSIPVTEMFRDPEYFKLLREKVFPMLRTFPFFKIWHAGCATGMEVYTLAIMLQEDKLYEKATIYATDYNNQAIQCPVAKVRCPDLPDWHRCRQGRWRVLRSPNQSEQS